MMKFNVLLGVILAVVGVHSSPVELKDPRFVLIPDVEGRMVLTDLHNIQLEPEAFFNPETDVPLLLFTRSNPTTPQFLTLNPGTVAASNFNPNHNTKFLIHGWNSNGQDGFNVQATAAYLARGDFNVICVDWALGAGTPNYITAVNRVSLVGAWLARFIDVLHTGGHPFSHINVIGFSLGAHVAGISGKFVNGRIPTIIGLDPAGPLFSMGNPGGRFDIGDADYTEGIKTNAGTLGFDLPIAHADFYPNGGSSQPGCGTDIGGGCAHGRAPAFFIESINTSTHFWATRCTGYDQILNNSCTSSGPDRPMGGEPGNRGTGTLGVYFLETNAASPFARGPR